MKGLWTRALRSGLVCALGVLLGAGLFTVLTVAKAAADGPTISLSTGGWVDLTASVTANDTIARDYVFVANATPQVNICSPCQTGQSPSTVSLGWQPTGTKLELGMTVYHYNPIIGWTNTGTYYSDGTAGSNPGPGATVTQQGANQWSVAFEDTGAAPDPDITVAITESTDTNMTQTAQQSAQLGPVNNSTDAHRACVGDPVNCATGNFLQSTTDISVPGRGPAPALSRTYNSLAAGVPSPFGYGWASSYTMSLATDPMCGCAATVTQENGSTASFNLMNGAWTSSLPNQLYATLTHNTDGTWTFVRAARSIFTFSSSGQLVSESDLNGNITSLSYNGAGQLVTVRDQAGRTVTITYGANGDVATASDPAGNVTHYAYDGAGELTSVTDSTGAVTGYGYQTGHLLTTLTHPNGGVLTNSYDAAGQVTQQVDPLGRITDFSYGSGSTTITEPNGSTTTENFDAQDDLLSQTVAAGTSQAATTSYTYDPNTYAELSVTDPDLYKTTYAYDANGNLTQVIDPFGNVTTNTYNGLDEPLTSMTPLGFTTSYVYDAHGNLTSVSKPITDSSTQTTTYAHGDAAHPGDLTAVTDADGHTTTYTHDAYGDIVSTTDPLGDITTATYNVLGQKVTSTSPDGNAAGAHPAAFTTKYTYDPLGRTLSTTDPLGDTTVKSYDGDGNLISLTTPDSQVTKYAYDADDELVSTTLPDGAVNANGYDVEGNLVAQKNADGHSTSYGYNLLNQKTSSTDALGHITTYVHDGSGRLLSTTSPTNVIASYRYNSDGLLEGVSYSDGTPTVTNFYDPDGRLTFQSVNGNQDNFSYDDLGHLTEDSGIFGGGATDVQYSYDPAGNLISVSDPQVVSAAYTYNAANQMTSVNDGSGNTTGFAYDPNGNLTTISHPDGSTDTYGFNTANQITNVQATTPNATLYDLSTPRNVDGNVASQTASVSGTLGTATTYSYDANQELTGTSVGTGSVSTPASGFGYDPAGNLTSLSLAGQGVQTNTYNAADELVSSTNPTNQASTTYAYNAADERTGETTTIAGEQVNTTFSWNGAGELTGSSTHPVTPVSGTSGGSGTYLYDGFGLLASGSIGAITYDFASPMPEIISDGIHGFIRGPDGLVVEETTLGQAPLYYHHDQIGSTKALTDSSGHDIVNYTYSPYGLSTASATGIFNPIGFANSFTDATSGLIYLLNRWYDPSTAQFLSVDPLLELTSQPYSYANDDPINITDPNGKCGGGCPVWQEGLAAFESAELLSYSTLFAYLTVVTAIAFPFSLALLIPLATLAAGSLATGTASGLEGYELYSCISG